MTKDRLAVLVIDSDPKHLAALSRIIRTVVPSAQTAASIDGGLDLAGADLIVANYDRLSAEDRATVLSATAKSGPTVPKLLLLHAVEHDYRALFLELEQHGLTNLLAHDTEVAPRELIVTMQKILRHDIFGLDKYFGWGVQPFTRRVVRSNQTRAVVDEATRYATDLGIHPRLVANLATVVHELLTNALYNAPVDEAGRPRFAHLPRSEEVVLQDHEEVTVGICCDGERLGISVADSFGAMTKDQCLDYLVKCLKREATQPQQTNKGGAGLGLYMTFDSLNHLVLNIGPGSCTEVLGLMDVRGSYRDFVKRGKSFNVFVNPQADEG